MHSHEWSSCFIDSLRIVELFFLKKTLFRDQLSSSRKMGQHDEWDEVGFWEFFKAAKTVYVCVYLYIYMYMATPVWLIFQVLIESICSYVI